MAVFCLNCWNKINEISLTKKDVKVSKDLYLCEGCGKMKNVILFYEKLGIIKLLLKKYFEDN